MGRTRLRTPALRRRFVAAAHEVLEADGIARITTRRVAARAGSSLAALNELFGNKGGLVDAVALDGFAQLAAEIEASQTQASPRGRLIETCRAHGRFVAANPELAGLMFSRPHATFEPRAEDEAVATAIRRAFTGPMAEMLGVERSDPAVVDLSIGLVALIEGLVRHRRGGLLGLDEAAGNRRVERAVSTYLAGVAAVPEDHLK